MAAGHAGDAVQYQYMYGNSYTIPNMGGAVGPVIGSPIVAAGSNPWTTTFIGGPAVKTPLELFEDLAGTIKLLETALKLNPKDADKHKWLDKIMGLVQEHELNEMTKRLKALNL